YTRSKGRGTNNSRSEQYQKVPLMTPDQILKLDQGECIFINSGYRGGQEASVPIRLKVKLPKKEMDAQQKSEDLWKAKVRDRLIHRNVTTAQIRCNTIQ
ncbi:MAG: type IV secretory system conjugative DNA transfer family protein, partial [Moorea sp. SIO3C2]|nr:type IV secretory system conjugative DNA transfer family protein [Moorena sp. SIO3C2]